MSKSIPERFRVLTLKQDKSFRFKVFDSVNTRFQFEVISNGNEDETRSKAFWLARVLNVEFRDCVCDEFHECVYHHTVGIGGFDSMRGDYLKDDTYEE